jgi:hypothetical protein
MAEPAAAIAASAASQVRDLADLLGQRSPGTRTEAQLTKHARVAAKIGAKPKPAAPAGHKDEPGAPSTTALVDLLQPPIAPVAVASNALPPAIAPPTSLNSILNSTPGFTPPSDGGAARLPTSEPREVLPPSSAVPEPGTWALMLMGFGLIGWQMRRRRGASAAKTAKRAAN